ncbi:Growth hormone-regulated TBC protein 1 [Fukomys damarensis]|uniref:Growth hormone-regulated TBC protein 1 n=1 Tax=Fukomys damarensis TaxID=885580 RepID=A0A091DX39_FUKDA|nr:Growth hormone-regulated TBC protein 1 [Fukomys damarensis]
MDAQALRKRLSRTSGEAARTLLSSLLLYVLDRAEGPPQAENGEHRASCSALPQEASRRPTRFQLLQAKFMGRGREPPLKRTREVGRLISKDRQGPSRSFVNATINKLLEKAGEASGPSQRPAAPEKPRWGGTGGKSTVKNILKKFLAAEEREAKEKEVHERPTGLRPGATRGPLSKVAGRSTILAKLRERFEQSGCLHAEVKVLPLHKEDRRSRALQRRMHRPEVRVLHMAAMAISCTRTPPARFLACTAEPLPSLSIATVVGSPHSWLSRCAKISHLDARRQARTEASLYPSLGHTEPGGNETPGVGILSGDPRGQWKPSESSVPQAMALWDPHPALTIAGALQPEFPCASSKDRALPGHLPAVALLSPASPRDARPAGGDRMVEPTAAGAADHIPGVEEGAEEAPRVTMTVCSSEDEAESTVPASEREPLFATQRRWLPKPQQEAEPHVTPAIPAVQAVQSTQPGIESPQITVQLPVVLKMPQRSTLSPEAWCPQVSQGEAVMGRGAPGPVAGDRRDTPAPERLSRPGQVPERPLSSEPGPQRALRDAAGMEHNTPQPVLTPKSPSSTGKGNCCSHPEPSGPTTSVYSSETHTLPVSNETKMLNQTHVVEAPPTRQAPELPAPGQQAEPRAVPKVKSSGPAPAGMGPPEGHCGPVCSQQTGRQDSPQKMARVGPEVGEFEPETWAALDLAESKASKKPATRGKPGTSRALDQEHMQGPSVRWVGSPAQRDGTQAAGSPAAQDQGWARGTVSQARDQPGRVAKEAPTAGASRDPSTPAPSIGSQGSPSTRRPTQGDKSTSDCHPQPADGSALPAPDVGSHQVPKVLAQAGSPVTPGAEREQSECEQRRRLVQLAKYKAQSFSDQRAFDLSFRPMVLQASHTFEAPKSRRAQLSARPPSLHPCALWGLCSPTPFPAQCIPSHQDPGRVALPSSHKLPAMPKEFLMFTLNFDYAAHEEFLSAYLAVLTRRALKWSRLLQGDSGLSRTSTEPKTPPCLQEFCFLAACSWVLEPTLGSITSCALIVAVLGKPPEANERIRGTCCVLRVKRYVRKGVPLEHRARVWLAVSGAQAQMEQNPGYYQQLLQGEGKPELEEAIRTDLNRTFPDNVRFRKTAQPCLQKALYNVLLAYGLHNPGVGYCQGMNFVAGYLILITKNEEESFWLLDALIGRILPDYYSPAMLGLKTDQEVLAELVRMKLPAVAALLDGHGVLWTLVVSRWFICLFVDILPVETVLRIWDCLFNEGSKIIFRVALTLLKQHQAFILEATSVPDICDKFKQITRGAFVEQCHTFMQKIFSQPGSLSMTTITRLRESCQAALLAQR